MSVTAETAATGILDEGAVVQAAGFHVLPSPVEVAPSGRVVSLQWRPVQGATGVRVLTSTASVHPVTTGTGRNLGLVAAAKDEVQSITLNSPAPGSLLRALRIPSFYRHEGADAVRIRTQGDLGGRRLVLTPIVGGSELAPVIAVPHLGKKKALPAQLTGGALSGELFTVPDLAGDRFKVTLVDGDAPEDFDPQTISHGDVVWYSAPGPVGLHIDDPGGRELYAIGGPVVAATTVDVRAALERHLNPVVTSGPAVASLTVRSDVTGSASIVWQTDGIIERSIEGRLSIDVLGGSSSIVIPPPHPGRAPRFTRGDVAVEHHGIALHPISDPPPQTDAGLGGPAVRDEPVVRELPPEALRGMQLARVAVFGWAQGETDLSLTVLGSTTSVESLSAPTDRTAPATVWFEFEPPLDVEEPLDIALTATRGGFAWIADPEPLVQLAVITTPTGEKVAVGGTEVELTDSETVASGVMLAGTDHWTVATDQFCTVTVSNAVMEFLP